MTASAAANRARGKSGSQRSVPELVLHLHADFTRIGEVRSSKSVGVIQQVMMVREVEPGNPDAPAFAEGFAQSQAVSRMRGQVRGAFAVEKAGAVVDVKVRPGPPGQR